MIVFVFIIFCVFIYIFTRTNSNVNSINLDDCAQNIETKITLKQTAPIGIEFFKLSKNTQKKITSCNSLLLLVLKNNLQYVPNDVLSLQQIKDTICAYIYYYSYTLYESCNLSDREKYIAFLSVLGMLFIPGAMLKGCNVDIYLESFDLNITKDERFFFFQKTIPLFLKLEIKEQTGLLAAIEQHMESLTGKRVRYMELNKDKKR